MQERLQYDEMRKKLTEQLKKVFRPEFLNRVDAVIVFRALNRDEISQIVDLEVFKVAQRLKEHALTLELTPEARVLLAEKGYDPDFGARPLKRVIQAEVEDKLSDQLLSGQFQEGDSVLVDAADGEVLLRLREEAPPPDEAEPEAEALPMA